MTSDGDTMQLLRRLWAHVGPRRRLQLAGFVLLVAAGAVAEVVSLGLVIPFLAVLTDPARIFDDERLQPLLLALQIEGPDELLLPLTVCFCALGCLSAAVRFGMVWAHVRLGAGIGNDLGEEAFRRTLYQPYLVHVGRNSSEVLAALLNKADTTVYYLLIPLLNLAGSALVGAAILAFMLWTSLLLTVGASVILGGSYAVIVALNRPRIAASGRRVTEGQTRVAQVVQEGLGGIRDVLLGGQQAFFVRRFCDANRSLRNSVGTIAILGNAPRYAVDGLLVVTVGAVVFHAAGGPGGIDAAIPTLGALALAIQRLMPLVQQAYFATTAVQGGRASLGDLLALLDQPLPETEAAGAVAALPFARALEFRDVTFRYGDDGRDVLRQVSVTIPKGSRVGVVGETGSGKSTFLDLAMGLILPRAGQLFIDDVALAEGSARAWQQRVAHVPQHVFLADVSIAANIAFGAEEGEIDMERVRAAARRAQLEATIQALPAGFATRVGERGVQLSGGQRQRIGIARALYREADVLVLDEATSALDDDTEDALVQALEGLGRSVTVLTVAHRRRSLRGCDFVLEIDRDGTVRRVDAGGAA